MAWGGRHHRAVSAGFLRTRRRPSRALVLVFERHIEISSPMVQVRVADPGHPADADYDASFDKRFLTDMYQRVYVAGGSLELQRSVVYQAAIHASPDGSTGFVEVPNTRIGPTHGGIVSFVQQDPAWFDGVEPNLALWTSVEQYSERWRGPFTVKHELWANAYRYSFALQAASDFKGFQKMGLDVGLDLTRRHDVLRRTD